MTSIGGDGARNDDGYDRKALTQVWQFSSYLDYGLGYNKSRGSCSSSQCDDDEDEKACSTSGMATDVGSMSMTFSRRVKQDDDSGPSESLKIRGCQYYLVGIICPSWLRWG